MKLLGVEKLENSLYSEWNLTYRVGWGHICRAASLIYEYTQDPEVFVGDASGEKDVLFAEKQSITHFMIEYITKNACCSPRNNIPFRFMSSQP